MGWSVYGAFGSVVVVQNVCTTMRGRRRRRERRRPYIRTLVLEQTLA